MISNLKIKNVPVSELNPAAYNPRDIDAESFVGLQESLKKFGMPQPIVVNKRTGLIVSGHQRAKAAQVLGWETVPVVEVDLSPTEEKALNVTLNNARITGHFTDGLAGILSELKVDLGLEDFGALRLDALELPDAWGTGQDEIDDIDENLDGIEATFKVRCPQEIKDEVLILLKRAVLESSLEGVEIA